MIGLQNELNELPTIDLALAAKTPPTDATVIGWKENDWNWLAFYKRASEVNPFLYRQIYKNYLSWYRNY